MLKRRRLIRPMKHLRNLAARKQKLTYIFTYIGRYTTQINQRAWELERENLISRHTLSVSLDRGMKDVIYAFKYQITMVSRRYNKFSAERWCASGTRYHKFPTDAEVQVELSIINFRPTWKCNENWYHKILTDVEIQVGFGIINFPPMRKCKWDSESKIFHRRRRASGTRNHKFATHDAKCKWESIPKFSTDVEVQVGPVS